jgi:hypothetical protein
MRQVRRQERRAATDLGSGGAHHTGAYAASPNWLAYTSKLSYQVANFLGCAVLTVVAVIDQQLGFILLEGAWALVSLWGIATILQRRGSLSPSAR